MCDESWRNKVTSITEGFDIGFYAVVPIRRNAVQAKKFYGVRFFIQKVHSHAAGCHAIFFEHFVLGNCVL